jgi:hypothetical protein
MTKRAPLSLKSAAVNKAAQPETEQPPVPPMLVDPPERDLIDGVGTTVHLTRHSFRELKRLALDQDTTVQALLVEGVNLVFAQHGLPQIAAVGKRPKSKKD